MRPFADRLIEKVTQKRNPCVVGLDPRIDCMPSFIVREARSGQKDSQQAIRECIVSYHERIIRIIADLVPAVKLQIAFYEQYGIPGLMAFVDTIKEAKRNGLLVIVDAKRNDISSTAQAYANAFLGVTSVFEEENSIWDVDCITISPYLGRDSLEPFIRTCYKYGKGIFVLVKTSNPGSTDLQDLKVTFGQRSEPLYASVATLVNHYAMGSIEKSGYSSIGAVVGATYPNEAKALRILMPHSIFLVPGYGAQGGKATDIVYCFNKDGLGAVVNSSRGITYDFQSANLNESEFDALICDRTSKMIADITSAIRGRRV